MRTKLWNIASFITLLAMLVSAVGMPNTVYAAASPSPKTQSLPNMQVIEASSHGVSRPLGELALEAANSAETPSYLKQAPERLVLPKSQKAASDGEFDRSILQDRPVGNNMPATEANFDGVNNVAGVLPPDTQGDIGYDPVTGKKYYVQWVNLYFQIWDVTNPAAPVAKLASPMAGNALFSSLGGICAANNDGDPITLATTWPIAG